MSSLNSVEPISEGGKAMELLQKRELLFATLLNGGITTACMVPTKHNLHQLLSETIADAHIKPLARYKGFEIVSLDCRKLTKGTAREWITNIAKRAIAGEKFIVVIENITEIPSGPAYMYDDPLYVENVLGRSWKDDCLSIGDWDFEIDRSREKLSVILTSSPEHKDELSKKFRLCAFFWLGDFDDELGSIQHGLDNLK